MQTMIELTVMFKSNDIPPLVLITGPFHEDEPDYHHDVLAGVADLRKEAGEKLNSDLTDDQCFYRFFRRAS